MGVDFIGKLTIKNPKRRKQVQTDIVQYTVIISHAGLMLYFLVALLFEMFCSKEQQQVKRREEQEQYLMKKRAAEVAAMKAAAAGDVSNQAWLKKANSNKINTKLTSGDVDHDDILGGFHAALGLDDLSSDSDDDSTDEETVVEAINIQPVKKTVAKRKQQEIENELDKMLKGETLKKGKANRRNNGAKNDLDSMLSKELKSPPQNSVKEEEIQEAKPTNIELSLFGDELGKALDNIDDQKKQKPKRKKSLKRTNTVML